MHLSGWLDGGAIPIPKCHFLYVPAIFKLPKKVPQLVRVCCVPAHPLPAEFLQ